VIKFGGEIRSFRDFLDVVSENTYGNFAFNGQLAGEGYAEFMLGMPTQSQRLDPLRNRLRRTYELGFYVTDTWKATRRLTLDYGLRWDYFRSPYYEDNFMHNWDPATGDVIVPQGMLGSISPLYPTNLIRVREGQVTPSPAKNNLRPRTGFAYRIADSFVVRGGYGQYTESLSAFARLITGTGPYRIADTYINLDEFRAGRAPFTFPNPFPSRLGAVASSQSIQGFPLETDNGVIHQFNVSIEKEVNRMGLRASYIGSRSRGLNYDISTNKPRPSLTPFNQNRRPFPQFINTTYSLSDGRSNYDSVQFEANRKWGAFTFIAHYTLSNAMSDWLNLQDPYDHYFWNRDQFNSRHRTVINTIWDLPFGKGRRWMSNPHPVAQFVLGGWQTQTVHYFQSGQYFSPSFSGSDPSNTNTVGGTPDRIANGNLPADQRQVQRWFDASAVAVPAAGRYGNSGLNILEGPGWNLHHLTVVKQFNVTERWKVLFQTNIADIFNTPHYNFPMANISQPQQVARLFQAQDSGNSRERGSQREITFRLRIEF
jgi:hypothetical protein